MFSPPTWRGDVGDFLSGELVRAGFSWRLAFDDASAPEAVPCLLSAGVKLHSFNRYPIIQDYLDRNWLTKVQPIIDCPVNLNNSSDTEWAALPRAFEETLETRLGEKYSQLYPKRHPNMRITHNNVDLLRNIAKELMLCIVWIEDQREAPLPHTFITPTPNDPALFLYLLESRGSISLLYHQNMQSGAVKEGFPFYGIVGKMEQPWTPGQVLAASWEMECLRKRESDEIRKENERIVLKEALVFSAKVSRTGVPLEAIPELEALKNACENYSSLSLGNSQPIIDLASVLQALQQPKLSQKELPSQHRLSACHSSQPQWPKTTFTCGHTFHISCMNVYLSLLFKLNLTEIKCPVCQHPISQASIEQLSPDTVQKYELIRTVTLQLHRSSFFCVSCGIEKPVKGVTHGCQVCLDCMSTRLYQGETTCGVCGRQYTAEDRHLHTAATR